MMNFSVPETVFIGNSEMATLMRSHDWSQTLLGPVETWSQALKTAVSICLNSRFPMVIWWGNDLVLLYNDAWQPILGTKHPTALGKPGREVWSEIWDIIGAQLRSVLETGQATWSDDMLLLVQRYGYTEEAYFTYSYSPIFLETEKVGGAFTAVTETTRRVIGERRLSTLRELAANTVEAKSVAETCQIAGSTLANNPYDIPFALIYLVESNGQQARLMQSVRVDADVAASSQQVDLTQQRDCWQFTQVQQTGHARIINDLNSHMGQLPGGEWNDPPRSAIVLPITQAGQKEQLAGFLVLGISPRREFDDDYRGFFDLVVNYVATAIANAQSYEEERKRAEALAELDHAKTLFFSNVSHEFRTPLTLMLGPLEETLNRLQGQLPPLEQEQLQMVQRNGLRLLKLVNTLLDFSRIEAGRLQAVYEPTDLATFTAELASVFRAAIERAGLQLVVDCPALPEQVYVDREMWEKIVLNLLSNAFKFTFEGEIRVNLQLAAGESQGNVVLVVQDTGTGIPAAELPHIFKRFHRVRGARGRSYEGSGIGLSLVQELVRLHGGYISVSSIMDQGTCFTVSIPTGCAHLPDECIRATRTQASTALGAIPYVEEALRWLPHKNLAKEDSPLFPPSFPSLPLPPSSPRILLADDNADMRDYLQRLLDQHYQVEAVANGMAALASIRRQLPDLLLTDVMMPELDGFGLLRELRTDPQTQDLPIILLSARAGEEARIEGLTAGADDYLTKPFSARELLARVEANLKLAQLRRESMQREQVLRLEAETAKQQAETAYARIDQILACMTDAFVAFDRNWCYTYANPAALHLLQKSPAELIGNNVWELFPSEVNGLAYRELHRALAEQMFVSWEEFGELVQRWIEVRAYPAPEGMAVYFQDITDRKQVETAIRESDERLRLATESANLGMWYWDVSTNMLIWTDRAKAMFGLPVDTEMSMQVFLAAVHPDDRQLIQAIIGDLQAGQLRTEDEYRTLWPDGTVRWILAKGSSTYNSAGTLVSTRGVLMDITDRKQLEAEQVRLLKLEQSAREAAEAANRIKDEFLAIVFHELRSPLNPILGWSKLLRTRQLNQEQTTRALEVIERNAQMQAQLINDLLDVSRILRGKLSLEIRPVDLASTILAALETVRLAAEAKSIQIHTQFEAEIGRVAGDVSRLQQVVWNLLSNAVKFTTEGGQVEIQLKRSGSQAHIVVRDTGKGIPPDFLPYVFDHFRQESSTTTRRFGGLGLGLAIVRYLVELHGGTVQADSPGSGQGATFTVKLPLMPHQIALNREAMPSKLPQNIQGSRILVVDDDDNTREFLSFLLELHGANVIAVATASEAIATLIQFQPELLLSDIGMPDVDGYMLMKQVRALSPERGGTIPAIALTAYAGEIDHQKAISAGFQRHLSKPIEPQVLLQAIAELKGCLKGN